MNVRYDAYVWPEASLLAVVEYLTELLVIDLELRESSYFGGHYYRWKGGEYAEIVVQRNFRDDEGYLLQEECEPDAILIFTSQLSLEQNEILENSGDLTQLFSEIIPS